LSSEYEPGGLALTLVPAAFFIVICCLQHTVILSWWVIAFIVSVFCHHHWLMAMTGISYTAEKYSHTALTNNIVHVNGKSITSTLISW